MKLFAIIGGAVLALMLGAALVGQLDSDRYDPARYARAEAEAARIAQQRQIDAQLYPVKLLAGAVVTLAPALIIIGATAWGAVALVRFRRERMPRRGDGLLPVSLPVLDGAAVNALGAYHGARQIEAGRQLVPHTISYAPRVDYRGIAGGDVAPALTDAGTAGPVPSFSQLLDSGRIGRGNPLLLGYDASTGDPIEGSWLQLYSTAVGGLSGSGKTWTATFLAAQAALFGARIVLLDPHAGNVESLAARLDPMRGRYLCEPASEPGAQRAAVALVANELERRKAGGRGEPWLFIADEFSAMQRGALAEPLAALVEALGQEGRKLGMYGMVCGQVWSATRAGGTELRDSLASAYVHRLRPAQARMLTGLTAADLPGDLIELPPGCAYLLDTAGDLRKVVIPQMDPADLGRVAALLGGASTPGAPSPAPTTDRPLGFRAPSPRRPAEGGAEGATEGAGVAPLRPHQDAPKLTAEEAAIVGAFLGGKSPNQIAAELAGSAGGDAYRKAAARVAAALRKALGEVSR